MATRVINKFQQNILTFNYLVPQSEACNTFDKFYLKKKYLSPEYLQIIGKLIIVKFQSHLNTVCFPNTSEREGEKAFFNIESI